MEVEAVAGEVDGEHAEGGLEGRRGADDGGGCGGGGEGCGFGGGGEEGRGDSGGGGGEGEGAGDGEDGWGREGRGALLVALGEREAAARAEDGVGGVLFQKGGECFAAVPEVLEAGGLQWRGDSAGSGGHDGCLVRYRVACLDVGDGC